MENNEMKKSLLSAQVDLSKFSSANFEKATDEEKRQQDVMGESTTFFKDGMRRLRKNPLAMGSISTHNFNNSYCTTHCSIFV